ncbi:MAG: response regulator [Bacteroidales bacterium]
MVRKRLNFFIKKEITKVLMDMKMPVMDRYEAVREIRKINPHAIVIPETTYAMSGDREKILQSGFDDYLPKSITHKCHRNIIGKYFKD